jgi:hypothetical protein
METLNDLLNRWHAWGDRNLWRKVLANPDSKPESRALAEKQLPELESATGLDALAANVELIKLMTGWRWLAIKSAREDGATWEQIGQVLGTSKQGAQLAYRRAIEAQETYAPDFHDAAAARAVLGTEDQDLGMMIRELSDSGMRDVLLTLVDRHPDLAARALADCARTWDPDGTDAAAAREG